MELTSRKHWISAGIVGGLIAGSIFALAQMLIGAALGNPLLAPWRAFASILLGNSALQGTFTFGVFLVGFVVHFVLSSLYGAIWGAIASAVPKNIREGWGPHTGAAMLYGLGVYLVNFQVIARGGYPWFLALNQGAQIFFHVVCFGLPLGLYLVSRVRPPARVRVPRRTTV